MDIGTLLILATAQIKAAVVAAMCTNATNQPVTLTAQQWLALWANTYDSILADDLQDRLPKLLDGKTYGAVPKGFEVAGPGGGGQAPAILQQIPDIIKQLGALAKEVSTLKTQQPPTPPAPPVVPVPATK
jgi:hypothetical protein